MTTNVVIGIVRVKQNQAKNIRKNNTVTSQQPLRLYTNPMHSLAQTKSHCRIKNFLFVANLL